MEKEWSFADASAMNGDESSTPPPGDDELNDQRGFRETNKARCPQCNSSWISPRRTDDGQDAIWCDGHDDYIHCPNCNSLRMEEFYITEQERKALICKYCNTAWAGK